MNTKDKDYKAYRSAKEQYEQCYDDCFERTSGPRWRRSFLHSTELGDARYALNNPKFHKFSYHNWLRSGIGPYAKIRNKRDRRHNRQAVKVNVERYLYDQFGELYVWDLVEYRYQHRHSARWDAW